MKNLLLVFFSLHCAFSFSQGAFFRVYSSLGSDKAEGIVQLQDSSFVVTGSSSSFYDGPSQAFLLKLDPEGNYLWSKDFGGPESESGRRVLYQENFGFFICGLTNSFGNGGYDFYLAKVDENANLEWEKSYGGEGWERVNDAALVSDSGVIMVGTASSSGFEGENMFMVRVDKNGDTLWTREMGGSGLDFLSSIQAMDDSTFLIGGVIYNSDSLMTKGYLSRIHQDGTILWEKQLGINGSYQLNDLCIRQNQIIAVGKRFDTAEDSDSHYFGCDMDGNMLYQAFYPGQTGNEGFEHVSTFGDSSEVYSVIMYENAWSSPNGTDFSIIRYSVPFNVQYDYTVYHDNPDQPQDLIRTHDGGVAIVGFATGAFVGSNDALVIKIGPNDSVPILDSWVGDIVAVSDHPSMDKFLLYPNPSSTSLMFQNADNSYTQLRIYDLFGNLVLSENYCEGKVLNTTLLMNGTYIVELSSASKPSQHHKLVVQH